MKNRMKRSYLPTLLIAISALFLGSTSYATNQNNGRPTLAKRGESIEKIVPEGWAYAHEKGDLNKDGIEDIILIAQPNYREKISTRDDGYEYNYNPNILAIYFGTESEGYKIFKMWDNVIPTEEDEYTKYESYLKITDKGVFDIIVNFFAIAGTYGTSNTTYKFRFQSGDFFLIGKEISGFSRSSGESSVVSYNFLTAKKCTTTGNMFDESVKKKVVWTKLVKRRLKPLGSFYLEP